MQGIMFTEAMFHAVIEGRKKQTRRTMKTQPVLKNGFWILGGAGWSDTIKSLRPVPCHSLYNRSRYKVGERLYLKEPYQLCGLQDLCYRYDKTECQRPYCDKKEWKNKLFMPAKYARYFIEITGVRCERLQDISDEDCLKEGIDKFFLKDGTNYGASLYYGVDKENAIFDTPQEAYAALINSINRKDTWDSNPWVWVYDYKLIKQTVMNKEIKIYRMPISKVFPKTNPRAGEKTYFVDKIDCALQNYPLLCECGWCGDYEDLTPNELDNGCDSIGMPVFVNDDRCPKCSEYAQEDCSWKGGIHKIHTIRANYSFWKKRIDKVMSGEAKLILFSWTGKPYRSKQQEEFDFDKDSVIGIQKLIFQQSSLNFPRVIRDDNAVVALNPTVLSKNDGLSMKDFEDWFKGYDLSQPMAIIHFTKFRY